MPGIGLTFYINLTEVVTIIYGIVFYYTEKTINSKQDNFYLEAVWLMKSHLCTTHALQQPDRWESEVNPDTLPTKGLRVYRYHTLDESIYKPPPVSSSSIG